MLLTTIIIFILVLGLLVFTHELGHFITAKRAGIKVEEFGLGLPPRIFGIKRGGTIYSLNWLPIGGFVKIFGEDGGGKDDAGSFSSRPAWTRAKILVAGVTMNYLFAMLLFSLSFAVGIPAMVDSQTLGARNVKIQITEVADKSPAMQAGILLGDTIVEVSDKNHLATKSINEINDLNNFINSHRGQEIILKIKRGQEIKSVALTPRQSPPANEGPIGVALAKTGIISFPWYSALYKGIIFTFQMTWLIVATFVGVVANLFRGAPAGVQFSGPVGIFELTGQMSQLGFSYLNQFVAFLSLNLAIINLFPFPALDGGRLFFLLIEKIKGSPINQTFERKANSIGLALLILLIVVITIKDIGRFF